MAGTIHATAVRAALSLSLSPQSIVEQDQQYCNIKTQKPTQLCFHCVHCARKCNACKNGGGALRQQMFANVHITIR